MAHIDLPIASHCSLVSGDRRTDYIPPEKQLSL